MHSDGRSRHTAGVLSDCRARASRDSSGPAAQGRLASNRAFVVGPDWHKSLPDSARSDNSEGSLRMKGWIERDSGCVMKLRRCDARGKLVPSSRQGRKEVAPEGGSRHDGLSVGARSRS